jgi:hypothetical protein
VKLDQAERERFEQPCVKRLAELTPEGGDFRWLLDLTACQ